LDKRTHLLGFGLQAERAHQLGQDQPERYALLRLRSEHVRRELDVFGLDALLFHLVDCTSQQILRLDRDERVRDAELRGRTQCLKYLLLQYCLDLALELELEVGFDLCAELVDASTGDAKLLCKRSVTCWQMRLRSE